MMMKSLIAPAAVAALALSAVAAPLPIFAQAPQGLTLQHRMLLRCSAAFALVAHGQEVGDAQALTYPPIGARGREYFVQAIAKVMDDTGMDREAVRAELTQEAQRLGERDSLDRIMPPCLTALQDIPADQRATQ